MEQLATAQRIHIIGGPGSGKSTLARQLARILQIPAYELDSIGYENGAGAKRPLAQRLADIQEIASLTEWIAEGVFLWWTDLLLEQADVIIWLDPPSRIALGRIVSRHVKTSLAGTNQHRGIRALLHFSRSAVRYYRETAVNPTAPDDDAAVTRTATMTTLQQVEQKVIRCCRSSDVAKVMKVLQRDRTAVDIG